MDQMPIRLATVGEPPPHNGNMVSDETLLKQNEALNPGRFQYLPKNMMWYHESGADPFNGIWLDQVLLNPDEEFTIIDQKTAWRSGPSKAGGIMDNAMPKAGYWTIAAGPNSNDSSNHAGVQMYTGSELPIMVHNIGHAAKTTQARSNYLGVIGWDGYILAEKQGDSDIEIGIPYLYAMYSCDLGEEQLNAILEFLEMLEGIDWPGLPDGINIEIPDEPHLVGVRQLVAELLARESKLSASPRGWISTVIKIIKKILDSGIINLGKDVDFLASMEINTRANSYRRPPIDNPSSSYWSWGNKNTYPHPKRVSVRVDPTVQIMLYLLRFRANGVLVHMSSPRSKAGGNRVRIMRYLNWAPIFGKGMLADFEEENDLMICLPHYDTGMDDPNALSDDRIRLDCRI